MGAEDRALLPRACEKNSCVSRAAIGSNVLPGITPRILGNSRPNFEANRLERRGLFAEDGGGIVLEGQKDAT